MYSDAWFNHAAYTSVRNYLAKQSSPVYYYYLAYKGSASFSIIFGDPNNDYGVSHADELQYLFPVSEQLFKNISLSKQDHKMVDIITNLWYNFAKFGWVKFLFKYSKLNSFKLSWNHFTERSIFSNPTPEVSEDIPIKWKPVRTQALEYLHIGQDNIRMSENLISERMKFWESLPVRSGLEDGGSKYRGKEEL